MADNCRKIAFISSYLPRPCGISVFCNDLIRSISSCGGTSFEPLVVALTSAAKHAYKEPVMYELRKNVKTDYINAADYLNFSHIDVVSIQHEYGLIGGECGSNLNFLLNRLNMPVITTMHTVLQEPSETCRLTTIELCEHSDRIVVMNRRGVSMLHEIYGIKESKITYIPHGVCDLPFVETDSYKLKFGIEGRKTILTFGLLSKNKGIELMLSAMPEIIRAVPDALYIILGITHPEVVRRDGEEYRFELQRIVERLGIQANVMFVNHFVNEDRLCNFLSAADIYVTPYKKAEQLTSGTLAFAMGAGKAIVSTPFWAAADLLANERGILVNFDDAHAMAKAVINIFKEEQNLFKLRRKAYDYSRTMTWQHVGKQYWKLFNDTHLGHNVLIKAQGLNCSLMLPQVPEPSLEHLKRMTDDTGLLQHASFSLPNRMHGYCTDDNARAVVAMCDHYALFGDPEAIVLLDIYLAFICYAQKPDGHFYNFMNYDRQWMQHEPVNDGLCRALWALGTAIARPVRLQMVPLLKEAFQRSAVHANQLGPRSRAYAIFGMRQYLRRFGQDDDIKQQLCTAADFLLNLLKNATDDWMWFEELLCYDNASLPHALFDAYMVTGCEPYLKAAVRTCDFLLKHTYRNNHFSFIGCKGWFCKGQEPARFDQQPLDAMETVRMLQAAYEATSNPVYNDLQKKAFNWFLGENDLSIPLYDFRTHGCADGLMDDSVNHNQGAESTLSFILALLSILESYSPPEKRPMIENPKIVSLSTMKPKLDRQNTQL